MRTPLFVLTVAALGTIATIASAQDAPPPAPGGAPPPGATPPPQGGPPPGAMAAPMPGADMPRGEEGERTANNAVFAELLGPGLFYSINYDRAIGDLAIRVGFSYFSIGASVSGPGGGASSSASFMTFPITASYLGLGSKKHMFEVGAGVTVLSVGAGASAFGAEAKAEETTSAILFAPTGIFGYRLQPPDGGFFFRAGLAPQVFIGGQDVAVWPAPYVSLGGTF